MVIQIEFALAFNSPEEIDFLQSHCLLESRQVDSLRYAHAFRMLCRPTKKDNVNAPKDQKESYPNGIPSYSLWFQKPEAIGCP